ncbi:MAG: FKBP-type peptidyl-prolyl cis-trans isomerase [Gemmatimonadota bacterium]
MDRRQFIRVAAAGAAAAACNPNDSTEPLPSAEIPLEDQVWSSSLGVNLPAMTLLPAGLYISDQVVGTGTVLAGSPTIRVYYSGYLANGSRFDGNVGAASPATFSLAGLIEGWRLGLQGMKAGGKRRLVIPSSLGYQSRAQRDQNGRVIIPANSNLVFDIELVGIN